MDSNQDEKLRPVSTHSSHHSSWPLPLLDIIHPRSSLKTPRVYRLANILPIYPLNPRENHPRRDASPANKSIALHWPPQVASSSYTRGCYGREGCEVEKTTDQSWHSIRTAIDPLSSDGYSQCYTLIEEKSPTPDDLRLICFRLPRNWITIPAGLAEQWMS